MSKHKTRLTYCIWCKERLWLCPCSTAENPHWVAIKASPTPGVCPYREDGGIQHEV